MKHRLQRLAQALAETLPGRGGRGRPPRRSACPPGAPSFDFDALAKDLAGGLSRREALSRLGTGLAATALAALGLSSAAAAAGSNACTQFCHGIYPPGPERGQCTNDASLQSGLCYGCGPAAAAGHPELCGTYGGPRYCCTSALPNCCGGTTCLNLQTDVTNCGACGNVCPSRPNSTPACSQGICGYVCNRGFLDCNASAADGCEINALTDIGNCGACNTVCPIPPNATATCSGGACGYACNANFADCNGSPVDGCEVNLLTDIQNCGACGHVCSTGYGCCNGACTNLSTTSNCGACGHTCGANQGCCGGTCTDLTTTANCGACGNACPARANATAVCTSGACGFACLAGFGDCNNIAADGCETPLNTTSNCGACGHACPSGEACVNGQCTCGKVTGPCPGSQVCCGGMCTDLTTSASNCGGCGVVCSSNHMATVTCSGGVCNGTCATGYADCNHNLQTDGCETNISSDVNNCGTCGHACTTSVANATASCSNGVCGFTCNAGYANCNGSCLDTTSDVNNCGSCGHVCTTSVAFAVPLCTVEGCTYGCLYGSCNGVCFDAMNDANNCGSCGHVCPAGQVCVNGRCTINCPAGTTKCDLTCANLSTDPTNCGSCFNVCTWVPNGTGICTNGSCGIQCNPGYTLCNGACVNLNTDPTHCGACGANCVSPGFPNTCCNGACCATFSGPSGGYTCCNGTTCTNLAIDPNNCGQCGNVCSSGVCCNGSCYPSGSTCCGTGACAPGVVCCNYSCCSSGQVCSDGICCPSGQTNCSGACTDLTTDAHNCGQCGNDCASANGPAPANSHWTCTFDVITGGRTCAPACNSGWTDCDLDLQNYPTSNGCETDLSSNFCNCGSCGHACDPCYICVRGACLFDFGATCFQTCH